MKKPTFRRFLAFIVDIILVTLIAGMFARLIILNPNRDELNDKNKQLVDYASEIINNEENISKIGEDQTIRDLSYEVSFLGVYADIITLIITFGYFGIFQYFTGGKTIGKLIFGVKVISTKKEKLSLIQTMIRSAIVNGVIKSATLIIFVLYLSKNSYIEFGSYVNIFHFGVILVCIGMILYRKDGVGLHDLLASTAVVNNYETYNDYKEVYLDTKENDDKKSNEVEVKEAKIIEEEPKEKKKKVVKKSTKTVEKKNKVTKSKKEVKK